jgi:hydrogenase maturation protein HypF
VANQPLTHDAQYTSPAITAWHIVLSGQVQGVGFRPFIYRLAASHHLSGWVRNCVGVVDVHVQGSLLDLENFQRDIFAKKPPLAQPKLDFSSQVKLADYSDFSILPSLQQGEARISVPADLFLCDDCLAELNNPADRRYRYPFINCTQCGPRYTLIRNLPYDRPNTSMAEFVLCPQCRAEYENPLDRRFHAEPVACPDCGPSLSFHRDDNVLHNNEAALKNTITALQQGCVVAVKGIGGYHLMCDATNNDAVMRLRHNKPRPHKPLAVMFPSPADQPFKFADLSLALTDHDKTFLMQPARPILLVAKKPTTDLSEHIAPGLNEVGMMLPYSPLHHLLLNDFGKPLVATSANISGEPVLTQNEEVEKRLAHVTEAFLHHNRPIERAADDPVYRSIAGKPRPLRSGRGFAPMELTLPFTLKQPVLAVGAQMKNVITLAWRNRAVISPHIGEMDSTRTLEVFEHMIKDLQKLYAVTAELIICDAHPGYTTTRWAQKQNLPVQPVYHHHAHASAAYFECNTNNDAMAFTWDGVGYGEDGTLWGGETFIGKPGAWRRVASMRPFYLPGGDKASREPWRSAAALCWELGQIYEHIAQADALLQQAWQRKLNSPQSTSVGRLFDAAAALTGVRTMASFEGQGPMELEALCAAGAASTDYITLALNKHSQPNKTYSLYETNWAPLVDAMLDTSLTVNARASLFHASMAQVILQQAITMRAEHGVNNVCLAGGVFQNRVLTEQALALLTKNDFRVCLPERIPVNDAGISFGQVVEYGLGGISRN